MNTPLDLVSAVLGTAVLFLQVAGAVLLIALCAPKTDFGRVVGTFAQNRVVLLGLLLSLGGFLGSLFLSGVVGFPPCVLCWWQRIFLYPQVFLFGLAFFRKDRSSFLLDAILLLSGVGFIIGVYHSFLPFLGGDSVFCSIGNGVSCAKLYINAFGYITIPVMSATTFAVLILLMLHARQRAP